jgi:multidrug resistance efflux pump
MRHRGIPGVRQGIDAVTERLHISPLGALVFLLSAGLLAFIQFGSMGWARAPAVAQAVAARHPSPVATVVLESHVELGSEVDEGAPLVTLSPQFLNRELQLIDADIERLMSRARLEQAEMFQTEEERAASLEAAMAEARRDQLRAQAVGSRAKALASAAEEQLQQVQDQVEAGVAPIDELLQARWTFESERSGALEAKTLSQAEQYLIQSLEKTRTKGLKTSLLSEPLEAAHRAELELLLVRRRAVLEDLGALTVTARSSGRVVSVLPPGSAVARDTSVASVLPNHATELVAYVPPQQNANGISPGDEIHLSQVCPGTCKVLRRGPAVEEAPGQLSPLFGTPVFGTPIYLSLPEGCTVGVGQVLSVELPLGGR